MLSLIYTTTLRVSSIVISRFLLHLQAVSQRAERGDLSDFPIDAQCSDIHTIVFARALGSLGAQIEASDYMEEVEIQFDGGFTEAGAVVSVAITEG